MKVSLVIGVFTPRGHLAMSRDSFDCHSWKGLLLASSEERLRVLLDIGHCPGQPPTTQNYPVYDVNSVEAEKLCDNPPQNRVP